VISDFFAIPGTRNVSVLENEDRILIDAEVIDDVQEPKCFCGIPMRRSGFECRSVVDAPVHGRRVLVNIRRQRFRCQKDICPSVMWPLDGVDEGARISTRACEYIQTQAVMAPFAVVAANVGVGASTVRTKFDAHVVAPMAAKASQSAAVIGLDEVKLGRFRSMITDVKNRLPLDLLEERTKKGIIERLALMRGTAKVVVIDMCAMHRAAVQEALPDAAIVADKFHVLRFIGQKLDKGRQRLKKKRSRKPQSEAEKDEATALRGTLDGRFLLLTSRKNLTDAQKISLANWLKARPEMAQIARAKDRFEGFYNCETRADAEAYLDTWIASLEPIAAIVFAGVVKQLTAWRTEILAYWDHPYTAAYTEAMNGRLREISQSGRGYSWDVLRAKLLLSADVPRLSTLRPHANKKAARGVRGG
jgi:transposase